MPAHARRSHQEYALTVVPHAGETIAGVAERVAADVKARDAAIALMMVYGKITACAEVEGWLRRCLGLPDWPVLYVEGAGCANPVLAGIQIFAVDRREPLQRIVRDGRVAGTVFCDDDARHCLLGGLSPADPAAPRADQARDFFAGAQAALHEAGFTYGDLARTWFYNDEILSWYGDFNRVRTEFYLTQHFRSGSLPASTGIRGRNPRGAALVFAGWAVVPTAGGVLVQEVVSPLQCPAPAYGSSFSRAVEIVSGGRKRLLVSGTASIAADGKTVWPGDVRKQIERTMEVVEAILQSRELTFGGVTRATAYFKHAGEAALFREWCAAHGWSGLPAVPVCCDVCRDDLLFEIELDACAAV